MPLHETMPVPCEAPSHFRFRSSSDPTSRPRAGSLTLPGGKRRSGSIVQGFCAGAHPAKRRRITRAARFADARLATCMITNEPVEPVPKKENHSEEDFQLFCFERRGYDYDGPTVLPDEPREPPTTDQLRLFDIQDGTVDHEVFLAEENQEHQAALANIRGAIDFAMSVSKTSNQAGRFQSWILKYGKLGSYVGDERAHVVEGPFSFTATKGYYIDHTTALSFVEGYLPEERTLP